MPMATKHPLSRKLIACGAFGLGAFNLVLAMFPAPLAGLGEIEDVVPRDLIQGSRFILVLVGLLLLISARGLWHGKRLAWMVAVACAIGSAAAHPLKNIDVWGTGWSIGLLAALVAAQVEFRARSDPPTVRRGLAIAIGGLALVFLYSAVGLYFLDSDFRHPISLGLAIKDSARLILILPVTSSEPINRNGRWFIDSVRAAVLFMAAVGLLQLLQPVIYRASTLPHLRQRARHILEEYADSSLGFFALLPDKAYFFSRTGKAFLAYRTTGNTAVVLGDPFGDQADFDEIVDSFADHCRLNGWSFAFTQARPECLDLYRRHGLKALKTGEEAIVRVQDFTLNGTRMKHLRATMSRLSREGYRAEVLSPPHGDVLLDQLERISSEWLARGRRRERQFTLGYFDRDLLQQCEVLVARDLEDRVVAFANIVPSFKSRDGNFDMLRYGVEPKDIADFLYVSLIELFKQRGFEGMSLGLAPFSGEGAEKTTSPATLAMRLLYKHGSFLMRFQGLRRFKEKYATSWEPRFLVYPSESELPGIALAVARVGEIPKPASPRPRETGKVAGLPGAA